MNVNINPDAPALQLWHNQYPQVVAEKHRDSKLTIPAHLQPEARTSTSNQDLFCYTFKNKYNGC